MHYVPTLGSKIEALEREIQETREEGGNHYWERLRNLILTGHLYSEFYMNYYILRMFNIQKSEEDLFTTHILENITFQDKLNLLKSVDFFGKSIIVIEAKSGQHKVKLYRAVQLLNETRNVLAHNLKITTKMSQKFGKDSKFQYYFDIHHFKKILSQIIRELDSCCRYK